MSTRSLCLFSLLLLGAPALLGACATSTSAAAHGPLLLLHDLDSEQSSRFAKFGDELSCPCPDAQGQTLTQCLSGRLACNAALRTGEALAFFVAAGAPDAVTRQEMGTTVVAVQQPLRFDTSDRPRLGSPDAPVQMVVFEDFTCFHCARFAERLDELVARYPDTLSVVFKHYPLPQHDHARVAAIAAAAAHQQGKFWELARDFFAAESLSPVRIRELAEEHGLDMDRFERDIGSAQVAKLIDDDMTEANLADIPGTPSVYINGVEVGPDPRRIAWAIETELWLGAQSTTSDATLLAQNGGVPAAEPTAQASSPEPSGPQYPVLADFVSLLSAEEQARVERLAKAEICPCKGSFDSLDACLREPEGRCDLAIELGKLLLRTVMEKRSDSEIVDLFLDRVESANQVFSFDLANAPHKGADPASAKLVVVEFADYRCHFCQLALPVVDEILARHPEVTLYFLQFPLNPSGASADAARAALAAHAQGQFWEMHALLFANAEKLERGDLLGYAQQLGLDVARFEADLDAAETQASLDAQREQGSSARVRGTPSYYLDGVKFDGGTSQLEAAIEAALAAK